MDGGYENGQVWYNTEGTFERSALPFVDPELPDTPELEYFAHCGRMVKRLLRLNILDQMPKSEFFKKKMNTLLRGLLVSGFCGILFSVAWFMLFDAVSTSRILREGVPEQLIPPNLEQPHFHWYYTLPAFFNMILLLALNLVQAAHLYGGPQKSVFQNWRDFGYFLAGAFLIAGFAVPIYLHHTYVIPLISALLTIGGGTSIICSVLIFMRFFVIKAPL